jgi:hypothetical protein
VETALAFQPDFQAHRGAPFPTETSVTGHTYWSAGTRDDHTLLLRSNFLFGRFHGAWACTVQQSGGTLAVPVGSRKALPVPHQSGV